MIEKSISGAAERVLNAAVNNVRQEYAELGLTIPEECINEIEAQIYQKRMLSDEHSFSLIERTLEEIALGNKGKSSPYGEPELPYHTEETFHLDVALSHLNEEQRARLLNEVSPLMPGITQEEIDFLCSESGRRIESRAYQKEWRVRKD